MEPDLVIDIVKNDTLFWGLNSGDIASLASLIGVIISFLGVIASLITVLITLNKYKADKENQQNLDRKKQLEKLRKDLDEKIEVFFGPINELREESKILYNIFALDLKEEQQKQNNYFRTIEFLCNSDNTLSKPDEALLKEIRDLSNKTLELIEQKSWVVTNPALSSLLGKACAHFRIFELAYKKSLNGHWDKLADKDIAFPLELDGALTNEVRKLEEDYYRQKEQSFCQSNQKSRDNSNNTTQYYDEHAENYFSETMFLDISELYKRFRKYIKTGASILDVGCGVGRDTKYFIQHGYKVYSIDASNAMVEMCQKYPFSFCKQMDMKDIQFYEEFDAIWANASLLHLKSTEFRDVIKKLINAVKQEGIIFFSLKEKDNRSNPDDRYYEYYTIAKVLDIMSSFGNIEHIDSWTDGKCFNNFIFKKKTINKE